MKTALINRSFVDSKPATEDFTDSKYSYIEFADEKLNGFILRVSRSGLKTYILRARIKGGEVVAHTIGRHGQPWNASTARKEAEQILALLKLGIDPRQERREKKAEAVAQASHEAAVLRRDRLTLRSVFEEFCANDHSVKESTKKTYRGEIDKHISDWLDLPMIDITADMVMARYNEIFEHSKSAASMTFTVVRKMFNDAIADQDDLSESEQFLFRNPVQKLMRKNMWYESEPRTEFIKPESLPKWFEAVDSLPVGIFCDFFKLLLVTGLRKSEALKLMVDDCDFTNKTFLIRETKNGRPLCLPMTPYTERLLAGRVRDGKYVFTGLHGGKVTTVDRWVTHVIDASGIEFSSHDIRRTFCNYAQDAGLTDGQIKQIINHHRKSDVLNVHYVIRSADRMREPLQKAETYILNLARPGVLANA